MARFRNSNTQAAQDMARVHSADRRNRRTPLVDASLFQKLRFDHAMI
ncbi:hypothetical protein [Roseovarius phycicola]|uniref:Transposase n=1 Tax=Roseovarius phycicola TaxID=3080976 RepID=A0ABZ2HLN0_9RHOB